MTVQIQTTAPSTWQPLNGQGVLRISSWNRRTHESRDGFKVNVCTVNVGTLKGKGCEIVQMLKRRKANVCSIQEVRYKGNGSTTLGTGDAKYKLWYSGNDYGTNGVGLLLHIDLVDNVIEVERFNDRIMKIKMVLGKRVYHIFSAYAPQVGRPAEEKEAFLEQLEDAVSVINESDGIILAGDFNSHIGTSRDGYMDIMGPFGYGNRNPEGELLLDLCKNQNLKVANTYFKKDPEKLITYRSGDVATQIDLILWRPVNDAKILNCKVIPGEECLTQHRLVRADFMITGGSKKKWKGIKKLKLWKLKDPVLQEEFKRNVSADMSNFHGTWVEIEKKFLTACEEVCGRTSGRRGEERETWWWNDSLKALVDGKKLAYKQWQRTKSEADKRVYQERNKQVKREVARAKAAAWSQWSSDLHTMEGKQKMFRVAKQMRRNQKDVLGTNYIKDEVGNIKIHEDEVAERWKSYFDTLLNQENPNYFEEIDAVEGPLDGITMAEVSRALDSLKNGKAAGPSEITTEMFKHAGDQGLDMLVDFLQKLMQVEEPPSQWSESITIPLYKGKGDALECSKYRGLRLLEHGMKINEKVLVNRLTPLIQIKNSQFGCTAGKSTTDAIFIMRSLQEKYLQKNKQLFHIFVDLEKAFDRIPRSAIKWALRRQLVPERLITLIMSLYRNSGSQVRIAGVLSDRFPVSVGVHQGSVLSPFLFNIVMEEATKECGLGDPWELLYADDLVLTAE